MILKASQPEDIENVECISISSNGGSAYGGATSEEKRATQKYIQEK